MQSDGTSFLMGWGGKQMNELEQKNSLHKNYFLSSFKFDIVTFINKRYNYEPNGCRTEKQRTHKPIKTFVHVWDQTQVVLMFKR